MTIPAIVADRISELCKTEAGVERLVAAAIATERERCANIALQHICTFGSMAEEIHATATAKAIAAHIRSGKE